MTDIARHVEIKCFLQHFEIAGQQRKDRISREEDTQPVTSNVTMRMSREPAASTKCSSSGAHGRGYTRCDGPYGDEDVQRTSHQQHNETSRGLAGKRARLL